MQDLVMKLRLDNSAFNSAMASVQNSLQNAKKDFEGLSKAGETLSNVGGKLTATVTAPIAAIGTASSVTAMNFEESMNKVQALSGATGKDLKMLEDKAKEMGSTTQFSAKESADALGYMALAGWDAQQMGAALEPVLMLAGSAQMDLAQASDIVTDTMSMFGMEAKDAAKASDIFAKAQATSNTDVTGLSEALKYCGAAANAMGYDLADTSAILGVFANAGLKGSTAGTTLNAMFRDMKAKAENGTIAIGKNKVAIADANGNYRDMTDILADCIKATEGMTDVEADAALSAIFGTEALKGINIVREQGTDAIKEQEAKLRDCDGAAKEMNETMNSGTKGALTAMKSALEGVAITIGEKLNPFVEKAANFISELCSWFQNLSPEMQTTIMVVAGLAAAIGPLLLVIGSLITFVANVSTAITTLSGLFGAGGTAAGLFSGALAALGPVIAAVAAALGVLLVAKIGDSSNAILGLQEKFGTFGFFLSGICEFISGAVQASFGHILIIVQTVMEVIQAVISGRFKDIPNIIKESGAKMELNMQEAMDKMNLTTTRGMDNLRNATDSQLQGTVKSMETILDAVPRIAEGKYRTASQAVGKQLSEMDSQQITILKGMNDTTREMFNGIREGMSVDEASKKVESNLKQMAKAGKIDAETMQKDVSAALETMKNQMDTKTKEAATKADANLKNAKTSVDTNTKGMATDAATNTAQVAKATDENFKKANQSIQQEATNMYNGAKQSYTKLADIAKQSATNMYNGVKTSAEKMATSARSSASNMYNGVTTSTNSMANKAINDWSRVRSAYSKTITGKIQVTKTETTIKKTQKALAQSLNDLTSAINTNRSIAPGAINRNAMAASSSNVSINFNGSYSFRDRSDMDYFMNETAKRLKRKF